MPRNPANCNPVAFYSVQCSEGAFSSTLQVSEQVLALSYKFTLHVGDCATARRRFRAFGAVKHHRQGRLCLRMRSVWPRFLLTGFPGWQSSWIVSHEKRADTVMNWWNAAGRVCSPARVWIS